MQYQVPQFIDTEDKLVGPFSLRQFVYVGAAAVVCGICYFFVQTWLFVIVTIIALGGALALAFLKINGRPLIKVAVSAFNYYWKPQTYVWKPEHPVVAHRKPAAPAAERALPPIKHEQIREQDHKQDRPTTSWRSVFHSAPTTTPPTTPAHAPDATPPAVTAYPAASRTNSISAHTPATPSAYTSSPASSYSSVPARQISSPAAAPEEHELPPVQTIAQGDSLHKSWENLQSGTPDRPETRKTSARQFLEKKMAERYQIFQRQLGDREAARRVDYR